MSLALATARVRGRVGTVGTVVTVKAVRGRCRGVGVERVVFGTACLHVLLCNAIVIVEDVALLPHGTSNAVSLCAHANHE